MFGVCFQRTEITETQIKTFPLLHLPKKSKVGTLNLNKIESNILTFNGENLQCLDKPEVNMIYNPDNIKENFDKEAITLSFPGSNCAEINAKLEFKDLMGDQVAVEGDSTFTSFVNVANPTYNQEEDILEFEIVEEHFKKCVDLKIVLHVECNKTDTNISSQEFYHYGLKMKSSLIAEDEECTVQSFIDKKVTVALNTKLDDIYIKTMRNVIKEQMGFRKYTNRFNKRGGSPRQVNVGMIVGITVGALIATTIGK